MLTDNGQISTLTEPISARAVESMSRQNLYSKLQHLVLVTCVSFALPIVSSSYYLFGGTPLAVTSMRQSYRHLGSIVSELVALMVLWYVMGRQGKTKAEIGWDFKIFDIPKALGLLVVVLAVSYVALLPVQYIYRAYAGHFLAAKSLNSVLGLEISFLSIAFTCLNPFFEELIVRAYTMSEVISLGGGRTLAVIVSVIIQISYHLYQGLVHVLALIVIFTIFSIYFARTKKIMPIILAHLCLDWIGLLSRVF